MMVSLEVCHPSIWTSGPQTLTWMQEVIGKGSYGVVCSAVDSKTGEKVAIKKINNVFDHVSDATRILREIKLLRLLRHPGELPKALAIHNLTLGRTSSEETVN